MGWGIGTFEYCLHRNLQDSGSAWNQNCLANIDKCRDLELTFIKIKKKILDDLAKYQKITLFVG